MMRLNAAVALREGVAAPRVDETITEIETAATALEEAAALGGRKSARTRTRIGIAERKVLRGATESEMYRLEERRQMYRWRTNSELQTSLA
jgi:hypothetical protein